MKFIKDNFLIIIILLFLLSGSGNLLQYLNPTIVEKLKTKVVTLDVPREVVKYISLGPLPAKLHGVIFTKEDTIIKVIKNPSIFGPYIPTDPPAPNLNNIIKYNEIYAELDTTINSDPLNIKYFFWPRNEFIIDYTPRITVKDHYTEKTIELTKKPWIEFSHGIQAGIYITPEGNINTGVGYGVTISFN